MERSSPLPSVELTGTSAPTPPDTRIRPPLSVVLASTQPWPEVRRCLDALVPQARALGAELIVADGNGRSVPPDAYADVDLRVPALIGGSPYQLRALGLQAARGEIVAVTEDHCVVPSTWCRGVLDAHQRWPTAAVVGGAVENGATEHLIDWALFLVGNGGFLLPIPLGPRDKGVGQGNMSYKRWALPEECPAHGLIEVDNLRRLRARGMTVVFDDRLVVHHVQSLGLRGSLTLSFHNGRCQAAFAAFAMSRGERLWRLALAVFAPLRIARDTARIVLRTILRKGRQEREVILAAPLLALVIAAHIAGEIAGLVNGPGDSPRQMR